jgi:hypothetical protein
MKSFNLLTKCLGLNNVVEPTAEDFDPRVGVPWLSKCVNVDVTVEGKIKQRKGFLIKKSVDLHSLQGFGSFCLYVTGDALTIMGTDYNTTALRNVTVGAEMGYLQLLDKVYYGNGFETGYIKNGLSYLWTAPAYVGPVTMRTFSDPPIGTAFEFFASRVFIVAGSNVWYSEEFNYSSFDLARNYLPFESKLTMFLALPTGIWVSTMDNVYFIPKFEGVAKIDLIKKPGVSCIKGTAVKTSAQGLGVKSGGDAVVFTTNDGIFAGLESGELVNLTFDRLKLPSTYSVGSCMVDEDSYIVSIN